MYLTKTPRFIKNLFPNFIWNVPTKDKTIYLTFDDGPIPEVTPWVLEELEKYNAKASFFCVGENVKTYPEVYHQILENGHAIGNHTFNHLSGWASDNVPYFHNVRNCANEVHSNLFRPPYGRLKPKQIQFLQRHYKIIMWDVLSGDFDDSISNEQCFQNVIQNTKAGSIVVFHDSLKSEEKLRFVLPKVLKYFSALSYQFKKLEFSESEERRLEKQAV